MFIKELTLQNIRCFTAESLKLSESINLLVGPNNSGKSTVIKALYSLQSPNALEKKDIRKSTLGLRIEYLLAQLTEKDKRILGDKSSIGGWSQHIANDYKVAYSIRHDIKVISVDNILALSTGGVFSVEDNPIDKKEFRLLPTREDQSSFISPFFAKRKRTYLNFNTSKDESFLINEDLSYLPAKVQMLSNSSHPMNERFRKYCSEILGFQIGLIPQQDGRGYELGIFVDLSTSISIESMGEGVLNILGLIVTLLTENNRLFLLEELENDLHPKALKKLLNLIIEKSDENQFVISTHSNIVVKNLASKPNTNIFKLDWRPFEEIEGKKMNDIHTSYISKVENNPQERIDLLEFLGYDFFDFDLFNSYIIFEESSAEYLIRHFIIPEFFPQLTNKIRTIAAKGVDDLSPKFNDLHRLFLYLHLSPIYKKRTWVIADGDIAGINVIKEMKMKFKDFPDDRFLNFTKTDIELYFPKRFEREVTEVFATKKQQDSYREKKKDLNNKVFNWIKEDRETAKLEFSESAKELIQIIEVISHSISLSN